MDDQLFEEPLSEDPAENLRMENELLRLKLQAEFGASTHQIGDPPPELTNAFLKNIIEFERRFAAAELQPLKNLLGEEQFPCADSLDDEGLQAALQYVMNVMFHKQVVIKFMNEYDDGIKYRFITEQLIYHKVYMVNIPGLVIHLIYEDFFPDHESEIKEKTNELLSAWCDHNQEQHKWPIAEEIELPDGKRLTRKEVYNKLSAHLNSYSHFSDCRFDLEKIEYVMDQGFNTGTAYAEGRISYFAAKNLLPSHKINGPFKLHFKYELGWWEISYFILPGFSFE